MIWATLDNYCDTGDVVVGRAVANRGFLKALIQNGPFSEYHFFLGDAHDLQAFRTAYADLLQDAEGGRRIKLFVRPELPEQLKTTHYAVFHQSDFVTYLPGLTYLRNRWADRPFPITGTTHALSYQRFMSQYVQLLVGGTRAYDAVIATSPSGRQALRNLFEQLSGRFRTSLGVDLDFPGQMVTIPLGVETDRHAKGDRVHGRLALGIPQDRLVILSLSRFCEYSKADLFPLLQAFAATVRRSGRTDLLLLLAGAAGGSSYLESVKRQAASLGLAPMIRYHTDFPESDKTLLLNAADLFVSLVDNPQETFGLSLLEAMASGLPVVVSDFDGYRDLVEHGEDGFKVTTYWGQAVEEISDLAPVSYERLYHLQLSQSIAVDMEEAADYLVRLVGNSTLRKEMGEKARQKAQGRFDWKTVLHAYTDLWRGLGEEAARAEGAGERGISNPFRIDYVQAFGHYPSRLLEGGMEVGATELGAEVYRRRKTQGVYEDLWTSISLKLLRRILFLCIKDERHRPTVRFMVDTVALKQGIGEEKVVYHLLWMFKHGLIRFVHGSE